MLNKTNLFRLTEGVILIGLAALRVATIYQAGLIDYDGVRNWQIVQEIGQGNFMHLYHHVSPGFFLFYAPWHILQPGLYFYPIANTLLNIGGIWVLARFFKKEAFLSMGWYLFFLTLTGTSFLLISTARSFSIESPSLLLFTLVFRDYYRRFATPHYKYFYRAAGWLALGIAVNYKFILLLPVAFLFEVWQRDKLLSRQHWFKGMSLVALLLPLSVLGSWLLGLRPLQYLFAYGSLFFSGDVNAANRQGLFRWDLDFYMRYLLEFEAWLLLPGIMLFGWFYRKELFRQINLAHVPVFTAWVAFCWLAGMSVLLKAPRGILFALPLLYILAFWGWHRLLIRPGRKLYFMLLLLTGIGHNILRYRTQIWPYRQTNYTAVGEFIARHPTRRIVATVSNLAAPFMPAGTNLIPIIRPGQLDTITEQKYQYLLLDNYIYPTQALGFLLFKNLPAQASWSEPTLQSFYLYLEHAEFTGLTYEQTRRIYQIARRDSVQLRLIPIPPVLKQYQKNKPTQKEPAH